MKTALVQMNVIAGDIAGNLQYMKKHIVESEQKNFDAIAFPELCVGGYLIGDKFFDPDYLKQLRQANEDRRTAFGYDLRESQLP